MTMDKVVEGFYFMLFEIFPELRAGSGIYADGVLLFNGPDKGIVALAAQFTVFIAGTDSLHAWCVCARKRDFTPPTSSTIVTGDGGISRSLMSTT